VPSAFWPRLKEPHAPRRGGVCCCCSRCLALGCRLVMPVGSGDAIAPVPPAGLICFSARDVRPGSNAGAWRVTYCCSSFASGQALPGGLCGTRCWFWLAKPRHMFTRTCSPQRAVCRGCSRVVLTVEGQRGSAAAALRDAKRRVDGRAQRSRTRMGEWAACRSLNGSVRSTPGLASVDLTPAILLGEHGPGSASASAVTP